MNVLWYLPRKPDLHTAVGGNAAELYERGQPGDQDGLTLDLTGWVEV